MACYARLPFFSNGKILHTRNCLTSTYNLLSSKSDHIKVESTIQKPKKPLSAYLRFVREIWPEVKKENPNLSAIDVMKLTAKKWAIVDPIKKHDLQMQYNAQREIYEKELKEYKDSVPEIQVPIDTKKQKTHKKSMRKEMSEMLGKPKKPLNGFMLYCIKNRKNLQELKELSNNWNNMPEEEKSVYLLEAENLLKQYKCDLQQWEEKMIEMGHTNVVNPKTLLNLQNEKKSSTK